MDPIQSFAGQDVTPESSGAFTVDLRAAAHRYEQQARREPSLMLARLVQATVAAGGTQVRLELNNGIIEAQLCLPENGSSETAQAHLRAAILLARSLQPRRLTWHCQGQSVDLLAEDAFLPAQGQQGFPLQGLARWHFEPRPRRLWSVLTGGRRPDHMAFLHARCCFAPIPICVNGSPPLGNAFGGVRPHLLNLEFAWLHLVQRSAPRRLALVAPEPEFFAPGTVQLGSVEVQGSAPFGSRTTDRRLVLSGVEEPEVRCVDLFEKVVLYSPDLRSRPALALTNSTVPAGDSLLVRRLWEWTNGHAYQCDEVSGGKPPRYLLASIWVNRWEDERHLSELYPVLDGVVLNKVERSDFPRGYRVYFAGPDLNVDFSGLNVVQDSTFERYLRGISEQLQVLL